MMKLFLGALAMTGAFAIAACDSVDRAYDCNQICNKYKDCANANYDVGACESRCRDEAANSEAYEDKADNCQSCIDDRSCLGSVFNCGGECAGIVP